MFKTRYRIVVDNYAGYEVQSKVWWWPWWISPAVNTHSTIEAAKRYADGLRNKAVEYL